MFTLVHRQVVELDGMEFPLEGEAVNVEVLMDMSSILFGAFLKGIGDQLDLKLGLGHPTVLGQHRQIYELLEHHSAREEQLLCIEICYTLEDRDIECDMLILLTEDSVPFLEDRLQYLASSIAVARPVAYILHIGPDLAISPGY